MLKKALARLSASSFSSMVAAVGSLRFSRFADGLGLPLIATEVVALCKKFINWL